jgi:hypothetical protein
MLGARWIHGDDAELSGNEEAVGEDQRENGQEAGGDFYGAALEVDWRFTFALRE